MKEEIKYNKMGTPMRVVNYRRNNDIDIEFLDGHHYIKEHQTYSNFKKGSIKNPYDKTICGIGYIGVGNYQTGTKYKHTEEYQNWVCMLRRCYDEKLKDKYPAYYGICTVCDDWHNFQNFAKWWNDNIYQVDNERMHVDKDILCNGNKEYSPNKCIIVPQRINMLFKEKSNKYNLPNGIRPTSSGKYEVKYNGKYLGVFDTVEMCVIAYDNEKRKSIIDIADEYKNKIPEKLYNALI